MYTNSRDSFIEFESDMFSEPFRGASTASSLGTGSLPPESSYQLCQPGSRSALEMFSFDASSLSIPPASKTNIWSKDYKSSRERLFNHQEDQELHHDGKPPQKITLPAPIKNLAFWRGNGTSFSVSSTSRFFVIKSYNAVDVEASIENKIWTSTNLGNKRLNKAYCETRADHGSIFLFFLVNCSGHFCGLVEMKGKIDFARTSSVWVEKSRWKGIFPVDWLIVKDIPNRYFQHLRNPLNEHKPITNSRDTQEIPYDVAISMLKIYCSFR